jgi:putative transposase
MGFITYKFRVKDRVRQARLDAHAIACNQVWNYCNAAQVHAEQRWRGGLKSKWPTGFDLINLTSGTSKELGLHSDTIGAICRGFAKARDSKRGHLRFRSSFGKRRALGFIPFLKSSIRIESGYAIYLKMQFRFWHSRSILGEIRSGAFVQDARGRWYVTLHCVVQDDLPAGHGMVGIDLGLKHLAALSDGSKVPALRHYRQYEASLATAQRAHNKPRAQAIHAKIANARRHQLHEESTRIVRENRLIVVGDVNSAKLKKTRFGKSVSDAGWSMFRNMLRYKAARRQAVYIEADERWTSQMCSCCGSIPDSSPKGMGALGIRTWVCSDCGESHDRDVNAARNILRIGLERQPPDEGISGFGCIGAKTTNTRTDEMSEKLISEAARLAGLAFNSGYEAGKNKSRVIATEDGLVDGADFAREWVREQLQALLAPAPSQ